MPPILLVPIGFAVGAYGTLIGAGGGFILVPILLFLYPRERPATITAISLAVVFFNALSGSLAYARQRRIDYRTGLIFAAATAPGAIFGALAVNLIPRRLFDIIFGAVLMAVAAFILLRGGTESGRIVEPRRGLTLRTITDAAGDTYVYRFPMPLGIAISAVVGFLSSLLGIGGGIVHVPAMVEVLHFPVHIATATSHFILTFMALVGSGEHLVTGDLGPHAGFDKVFLLSLGVIPGAQVGARFSHRFKGVLIVRLLGAALFLVGLRLLVAAVSFLKLSAFCPLP